MLFKPVLDKIASNGWNLEVDPRKTEDAEKNTGHLIEACNMLFSSILGASDRVPGPILVWQEEQGGGWKNRYNWWRQGRLRSEDLRKTVET